MPCVLILYPSRIVNETRLNNIAQSVSKLEFVDRLVIIGIHQDGLKEFEDIAVKSKIWRVKLKVPLLIPGLKSITQLMEWYCRIFIRYRKEKISFIHCSSLEDLPAGVLFKILKGSKLLFDANEIETETSWLKGFRKTMSKFQESFLIRYPDYITVVSNSIAQWYKHTYKSIKNIEVIRNIPNVHKNHLDIIDQNKNILKNKFGLNTNDILIIYQGALLKERGVELLLEVFTKLKTDKHIVFMGSGKMVDQIKNYSQNFNNIHYHSEVNFKEVLYYTSGADIGIHLIENTCLNHFYCLPNKIFEYILAGLPLIVKNYPEIGGLVDKYECGWKVSDNKDEIINLINSISHENIINKKKNALKARHEFSWTDEETKLLNIYKKLNIE